LVLALLPLFPLWRAVFLGQTIGPWDHIRHMAPFNEAAPDKGWDVLQADACLQFYVWRDLVFHAWGSGHIPFWNPYQLGGTPLLANSQSGAFYPLHILVGVLHLPTALGITLLAWFHLAWAGIGTYFLVRRLGGNQLGALLAGGGFTLSAFLVAWTPLASVTTTVAWIPWCLWAAYRIGDGSSWKRAIQPMALLALCVAMMLLAGHLQFAAYGMVAIVVLIGFRAFQSPRYFVPMAIIGVLAAGIAAAPQILPVLANGQHSHRKNVPTWEGFQGYNSGAIQPFELLSIPDPTLLGLPSETVHISDQPFTGYWPAFVQRGASYAETAIGLGPLLLALLVLGWNSSALRKAWGVVAVAVVGFCLALGTILGAVLYFGIPGWSATASPGRASVLFVLACAVMAGTMFNQGEDIETPRKSGRRLAIVAAFLLLAAAGVSQFPLQSWLPQLPSEALAATRPTAMTLLFRVALGLGTAVLVWLALRKTEQESEAPSQRQILASLGALVLFAVPSTFLIPTGDSSLPPLADTKAQTNHSRIATVNGSWDLLQAGNATLPPNLASLYQLSDLSGYDSLIDKRVKQRIEDIDGQDPAPQANGNIMFVKSSADLNKLAEAGVKEVWSKKPLPQLPMVEPGSDGIYRYALQGPGRVSVDGKTNLAKVTEDSTDRIGLVADGPGKLVLRDNLDSNWQLTMDGKAMSFDVSLWPSVAIPSGHHDLTFSHSSGPSLLLLLGSFLALTIIAFIPFESRKIENDESNAA
jgi:hypothetical protein